MNKIYVVEGQDRCGKGTLVDCLRKVIKNEKILVIHSAKPPRDVNTKDWSIGYYENLRNTVLSLHALGFDIILDRSYVGETVYGPIYRQDTIPLSSIELPASFEHQEVIIMVDDASSIASRSDGLSMSDDLGSLEAERHAFIEAYHSLATNRKELIDWEYEAFSKSKLEAFARSMIDAN